ncbi:hypothetical protein [Comamonas thiooxydans]|uniref:Uncharacterized protein n=1 Tax=Comamonas thiooxydans TaxID=363952 RepID=A0A0E3BQJ4_9BURK|nr:hypothetical protein [Comamonas thiooxydans]KGH03996.1 hypothetical protein P608_24900 [Comamonas thiooxydans]KGH17668.1 hypothetical protein P606_26155 [Comamonas thiooxydans]KGH27964.1 hypothetical protein P607_03000 [Comamonas thiooxydans]
MAVKKKSKPTNVSTAVDTRQVDPAEFHTFEDAAIKLYVDTPLKMQVGPFISKIAFGTDEQAENTPAELVLTMPTPQLLELANGVFSMLGQTHVRNGMASQIKTFLQQVRDVPEEQAQSDS